MVNATAVIVAVLLAVFSRAAGAACVFQAQGWESMRAAQQVRELNAADAAHMDEDCFVAYLNRRARSGTDGQREKILSEIDSYRRASARFSTQLVLRILATLPAEGTSEISAALAGAWSMANGKPRDVLQELETSGAYASMDSVYQMLHAAGGLDVHDLMKWGRVKGIAKDHVGAARVFCFASSLQPQLSPVARAQLMQQLREADSADAGSVLEEYRRCSLARTGVDTADVLRWLSGMYALFDMYDEEVASVKAISADSARTGQALYAIARRRFGRHIFEHVAVPARIAYRYLDNEGEKRECAVLLYQSYCAINRGDSALVWFARAGLNDARSVVSAAALHQDAGLFVQADSMIQTLKPSVERDTLSFRQLVFEGKTSEARISVRAATDMRYWQHATLDAWLWRTRMAVYDGDLGAVVTCLDSAVFPASWYGAREMLGHKYTAQVFCTCPQAFGAWGRLQRALYIHRPESVFAEPLLKQYPAGIREMFDVTLGEALIERGEYARAVEVLSRGGGDQATPRGRYFLAEAQLMMGEVDAARKLFEQLVLEHPGDIFSSKARMYLLALDEKQRM